MLYLERSMLSVIVKAMPHSLCCIQGKEMFLFWYNNTDRKIQQQK